jgi:chorismate synthase
MRLITSGESHGPALIAILDGLPAGLPLNPEVIHRELARRQQGYGAGPRMKLEHDEAQILGGVMEGKTTGAPLSLLIPNRDHEKWRGKAVDPLTIPRPGHADLTGAIKYGYRDLRLALERASARETAARVAAGAVCKHLLSQFGITVGGYVIAIGQVSVDVEDLAYPDRLIRAEASDVRCPDPNGTEAMRALIRQTMTDRNTLGGIIEVLALGVPPGLGAYAQWEQRLDARLGAAALSVQAIKGVEIGPAFENARLPGTQAHDPIRLEAADGEIYRPTDRSGGLEGGITTGQPLIVRAAMKPIATTLTPQSTVDLASGQEVPTGYERSDFCPVPRAVPVLEAMIAFVLADALLAKLGGDSLGDLLPRYETLRRARLADLPMDGTSHIFWPEQSSL